MRSPLVRVAATTATLMPCHSSFRFPSLEWAWNLSPWGEGGGGREGHAIQAQVFLPAVQRVRPRPKAPLASHTHSRTCAQDLGLGEAEELLNRLADRHISQGHLRKGQVVRGTGWGDPPSPPLLGSLPKHGEEPGTCSRGQSVLGRRVSPAGKTETGCRGRETCGQNPTAASSPRALLRPYGHRERRPRAGDSSARQEGRWAEAQCSCQPGSSAGPAHLTLGRLWVQQLELTLKELVVSVQWVWHPLRLLLLGGCLQGLGQLDVGQHLR